MSREAPLEREDLAAGKAGSQVIVGPSVAEPEFENEAGRGDLAAGPVKDIALRGEPPDGTVESGHWPNLSEGNLEQDRDSSTA
jgi:hypothetical protein